MPQIQGPQPSGGIKVFVPATPGGLPPTSFADGISTGFPSAHGVLRDDIDALLPAIGDSDLRAPCRPHHGQHGAPLE
ncbi:hypothetical protein ABZ348_16130 [Streptomyces sp. NPDC005963]|uniref:hypothetical protein n=1 Tax=Streptomyces sp. NPDC005963 TaxID=3156721 RepID=UPI003408427B